MQAPPFLVGGLEILSTIEKSKWDQSTLPGGMEVADRSTQNRSDGKIDPENQLSTDRCLDGWVVPRESSSRICVCARARAHVCYTHFFNIKKGPLGSREMMHFLLISYGAVIAPFSDQIPRNGAAQPSELSWERQHFWARCLVFCCCSCAF